MTTRFNPTEVFELARQVERAGESFYRSAAARTEDAAAAKLLSELADYEVQHERTFAALAEELAGRGDVAAAQNDLDDTLGSYLRAMADGMVFPPGADPSTALPAETTLVEILRIALDMEQASIAVYTAIREAMPAAWGPGRIDPIIREERSHVVFLTEALRRRLGT